MSKIVEVARKEIGTVEVPKNSNKTKYGSWFGFDGVAWCGMFVSWCYFMAGKPLPKIGFTKGFAGCQTAVAYFKKSKQITKTPVAGDIVFFDWNKDGRYDHTGIFVRWISETQFESIEGNTAVGNDSNGGQVMLRKRNIDVSIFVHLM
jgi:hypothetical protein